MRTAMIASAAALAAGLGAPANGEARGIQKMRADAAGNGPDLAAAVALIEKINTEFTSFKEAHAEQMTELKAGKDDPLTAEKLTKIDASMAESQAAIDKLNEQFAAMDTAGTRAEGDDRTPEEIEYSATFETFFRTGDGETDVRAAMNAGKIRGATSVGSDEDGGFTAPIEWDRTITDQRVEISPMRKYASTQNVTGQGFKRLYNIHGTDAGWVGEEAARPETDTSNLKTYDYGFGEIYAMPAATQRILEDSEINLAEWMAGEVRLAFAKQEGTAFLTGDGVNKPTGVLQYTEALEAARAEARRHPLGHIKNTHSGAAGALTDLGLIDLVYDLPEDRSNGAAFYGNRKTHSEIRKMKDGQGNFLWQPPFQAGEPASVLGYPIRELAGMAHVEAGNIALMFGNMAETYRIFDRVGVMVLRDPYTRKPFVLFYTRKRVGGGLWNPEFMRYHTVGVAPAA